MRLTRLLALALALLASSCSRTTREDANPAPSSSLTREDAHSIARLFVILDGAKRTFMDVAPTGSMAPYIDSRSVLLLETVTATELSVNDIALYEREAGQPLICHRVKEIRADGIWFDGDNNPRGDGWVAPDRVRYRVAGTLYTRR